MNTHSDGFEIERGVTGRIKINVISVANLIALFTLIGTAVATWNGLSSKVDIISVRLDVATQTASQLRADLNNVAVVRDAVSRDLSSKVETMTNRLTVVETVLQRMERKLEKTDGR